MTSTDPRSPAGTSAVMEVPSALTVKAGVGDVPNLTADAPLKKFPTILTRVTADAVRVAGSRTVISGRGGASLGEWRSMMSSAVAETASTPASTSTG